MHESGVEGAVTAPRGRNLKTCASWGAGAARESLPEDCLGRGQQRWPEKKQRWEELVEYDRRRVTRMKAHEEIASHTDS